MITFLYTIWIGYTVGSLSFLLIAGSLTFLSNRKHKKQDEAIRKMLKARPLDSQD